MSTQLSKEIFVSENMSKNWVIASDASTENFLELINLIGSLHKYNFHCIWKIVVYDIGLTMEQCEILKKLAAVKIKDAPKFYPHTFAKGGWKLSAIKDCMENETAGAFLYCDASVKFQQDLMSIFKLIEQRGYALWHTGVRPNQKWITKCIYEILEVREFTDNIPQLLTTVQGYNSRGIIKAKLIDAAFALASDEKLFRQNAECSDNCYEQLLSILIAKYNIDVLEPKPYISLESADDENKKAIMWLGYKRDIDVNDRYVLQETQQSLTISEQTRLQLAADLHSTKHALNIAKAEEILFDLAEQNQLLVKAVDTLKLSVVNFSFHKDLIFQSFFDWLIHNFMPKNIVETGTFMGWTTEFMAQNYPFVTINTTEVNTYFYNISKNRLSKYGNVQQFLLSSEQFLLKWLPKVNLQDKCIFFLDAHWEHYWPLPQEIVAISATQRSAIIIIDDFKVPGHPEYGYDDYGEGKVCNFSAVISSLNPNNSYQALLPNYAGRHEAKLAEHLRGRLILFQNADDCFVAALNDQWVKQHFIEINIECSTTLEKEQNLSKNNTDHYFRSIYPQLPSTVYTGVTGKPPWEEIQEVTESKLHDFLGKAISDIRCIVIVGGHLGFEIDRILQNYPKAKIHVFEASPRYFNKLSERFIGNSRVFCYNYAVSDENGTAIFYETTIEGNGSLFPLKTQEDEQTWIAPDAHPAERHAVSTVTLDNFAPLAYQLLDLLWVDVQGAEMKILKGAQQTLQRCRALFLEVWTYKTMYEGQCRLPEMEKYLAEYDFYLSSIGVDRECGVGNSFWLRTNPTSEDGTMLSEKPPKIVALIPVRNESQHIDFCLRAIAKFADAICVLDDASSDKTIQIVESLAVQCRVDRIVRKQTWEYNETSYRQLLLDAGREIGGTHFMIIDADEAFTSNLAKNNYLRGKIFDLEPGDRLELAWIQLWRSTKQFRYDTSVWTNNYKAFVFADDNKCSYHSQKFHLERIPSNLSGQSYRIEGYKYGVLHFQFINWRNLLIKQAWYRCLERIMYPQKSVQQINDLYAPSKDETNLGLKESPQEWLSSYEFFNEAIYDTPEQWRETQVLQWFAQYSREYFAGLDIWDIDWGSGVTPLHNLAASTLGDMIHRSITADEYEMVQKVESIGGWFSSTEILAIYRTVKSLPNNAKILEIGSYRGRSTNAIGYAMQGSARELYCLDIWRDFEQQGIRKSDQTAHLLPLTDYAIFEEFLRNTEWFRDQLRILRGSTKQLQEILPKHFFDLIFIDGAHDYENVFQDITVSLQCLKPSGIICGHDYHTDGGQDVIKVVNELIFSNQRFSEHGVFNDSTLWFARHRESEDTSKLQLRLTASFKVSVIVSTYNSEKFIRGCLQDLVEQTLYKSGEVEVIVIDSNSEQNEQAIVREFQARYPSIFYRRTLERETLYAAWNRGIQAARGHYITNANTDDRHRPDALEVMANYLDTHPKTALVYADQLITTIANDTWAKTQADRCWNWPPFSYSELERRCIIGPQPMWRKSLHEKYGYFRSEFTAAGDYEFWLRVGKTEEIVRLPEILGLYYHNPHGLEHSSSMLSQQETHRIWDEYGILGREVIHISSVPVLLSPSTLNALPYRTEAFSQPLVSVIIPCYKYAKFLPEAVESVVNQTYQNWECIIVNDGSPDNTSEVARDLIEFYSHKNIRLLEKQNSGVVSSRNFGFEHSSGQFILFLDADDKIHSNFLEETVAVLIEDSSVGFVYTDIQMFGVKHDLLSYGDFDPERFLRSNQATVTSLFRREIYDLVGGFKKVMEIGWEDWEFWISVYEKGWQGHRLVKPYLYYRQHPSGSRQQNLSSVPSGQALQLAKIIKLHYKLYHQQEILWAEQTLLQHNRSLAMGLTELNLCPQTQAELQQIEYPPINCVSESSYRPFLSVMIPTYNPNLKYLVKTLRSVLEQELGVDEMQIEVVDDCSTQNDPETIVNEISRGRVQFYRQPRNLGIVANWNACIQRARGHWVHILHQDDLVLKGFYRCLQEALGKEPTVGAAFCRHSYIDEKDDCLVLSLLERETPGVLSDWLELIATMQRVQFPSIIVRRSTYEELGGFCPQARSAADWEMWKRIAAHYPVWYEPQLLASFRLHSASESSHLIRAGTNIADTRRAIEISKSYLPKAVTPELCIKAREYYALDALSRARSMLNRHDIAAAIAQIQEGLKCSNSPRVIRLLASLLTSNESEPLLRSVVLSNESDQFLTSVYDDEPIPKDEFELRDINLIIFPDWRQPEELLYQDLGNVIKSIIAHNETNRISLLIDNSNISAEDANFIVSDVVINILQQENLNFTEEPQISLLGELSEIQWKSLLQRIDARIILKNENRLAINKVGAENIPTIALEELETQDGAFSICVISASANKAAKKKALVFFPHNPYPPQTGAHQRCLAMLSGLKELGYDVTLLGSTLITDNPWQSNSINDLQNDLDVKVEVYQGTQVDWEFMKQMSATSKGLVNWDIYTPPGLRERFHQLFMQLTPDVVVINYALWGGLAIGEEFKSAVKIIDAYDLVTLNIQKRQVLEPYLKTVVFTPDQIDANLVAEDFFSKLQFEAAPEEYWIYDQYDYTIAIAPQEARAIQEHTNRTRIEYVPMTFTTESLNNSYSGAPLFVVGSNPFNVQGYLYFITKVLPVVLRQLPEFSLRVAGSSCHQLIPVDGIQLLGFVPELKSFYSESRFAVCPLIGGTGQQVKIVEAMAHGVPVIALRNVAESSPIQHGVNGFIADDAEEFAKYTIQLSLDRELCCQMGQAARKTIANSFSKDKLLEKLKFLEPEKLNIKNIRPERMLPKIVVDGVFSQLYQTGIARVWRSLLEEWAANGFAKHLVVLDRASKVPKIPGIKYRTVPPYEYSRRDADREMLQQVCDQEDADLFISSYYTSPLSTPSVVLVHDMIPELMGWELNHPMWQEKHNCIREAVAHIAVSENTARDLVKNFSHISLESVTVAHSGVNHQTWLPVTPEDIEGFKIKYGISKPYFILVGVVGDYKNTILFFKAFTQLCNKHNFEIVCTGVDELLEGEFRKFLDYTFGCTVHKLRLSDEELRAAYSGAVALVYPSKYEGFGLPILEANTCGCPVITCPNASIPEVAGEAALYVNDEDVNGLVNALSDIQKPEVRSILIAAGLEQAKKFSWSKMAQKVSGALINASLLPLKLKNINLIIFPDWSQPEESLCLGLQQAVEAVTTHPDKDEITLLVDIGDLPEEDASLILSSVTMNLLLQEEIDVSEGPEISMIGQLSKIQWQALLPCIDARIFLEKENQQAIADAGAGNIPYYK